MIQRFLGYFFGKIKICIYKLVYPRRISFKKGIRYNYESNLYIDKNSKVILGKNFNCRKNVSMWATNSGKLVIGDNAYINNNCFITAQKSITIGDNVLIGNNCTIVDNDHDYKNSIREFVCENIVIGNNVWLGCNVVILKGVKIGDNCVIAAGTIVDKDIPNNSIVYQKKELIINKK